MAAGLVVEIGARTQGSAARASVVRLIGSLEPTTLAVAERTVNPLLAKGPEVVVFDLTDLEFISSAGLGFLIGAKATVEKRGGKCFLSSMPPKIRRVFDVMKAIPSTAIFSSRKELDDYLAEIQRKSDDGD